MSARLRVLHCCYDDPDNPWVGGGGARRVFELYRHLDDRVDATIATGNYPGATDGVRGGISVQRLGMRRPYAVSRLTYAAAATRLLARATYDVAVVDHSAYAPVRAPAHRPVGITVHHLTGPVARERWGRTIGAMIAATERAMIRRARVLSATSASTARTLQTIVSDRTTIVDVASGVDDRFFALERCPKDYVLYVGRLDVSQKGLDVLLDAWARVARLGLGTRLVIAGRGPDEQSLKARANSLGLGASVEFVGEVSDVMRDRLLEGAVCQIMPSRFEGFGIAAVEALAAGVPLIVSDDPALFELAANHVALVAPRNDATALAACLGSFLEDPRARLRHTERGREAAKRFRWPVVAEAHFAYLCQVMTKSGATLPKVHVDDGRSAR
jgi:glycosyltransferase involved in cell wall biosynthesis